RLEERAVWNFNRGDVTHGGNGVKSIALSALPVARFPRGSPPPLRGAEHEGQPHPMGESHHGISVSSRRRESPWQSGGALTDPARRFKVASRAAPRRPIEKSSTRAVTSTSVATNGADEVAGSNPSRLRTNSGWSCS